ncbi:uncharacterized protein LOC111625639 [Centruroides sculpturatus]|uniref:uncharacterized protein LOC111625639 n=1 Tax=Centruroides sculpturatus TaxID=218467 RepID=UPI000C6D5903|nr:uncharacterized protein LOC111625639 [Centruroides sculpturatus]XP_023224618.1 uncharacterized protein LOC111625639 [Centruroides sculpturatus]
MGTCIGPKLAEISMIQIDEQIRNIEGIEFYRRNEEKNDIMEEKGVLYSFDCNCNPEKTYIGETKRKLGIRLKEHIRAIRGNYANSAVAEHCNSTGCEIILKSVKIRKKEENNYKRQLYEHINIIKQNIRMNNNNGREIHQSWRRMIDTNRKSTYKGNNSDRERQSESEERQVEM